MQGFEIYEKDYNDLRELVPDLPEWKASNVSRNDTIIEFISKNTSELSIHICFYLTCETQNVKPV